MLKEWKHIARLVFVAVIVTVAVAWLPEVLGLTGDNAAHIGDWVAGATTIVVQAVVVYFLYKTYRSQKTELEEQKQILKVAHDEAMRKRFEDGFFFLLRRYEEVVQGLTLPGNDHYRARRVFPGLADECGSLLSHDASGKGIRDLFAQHDWWLGDWVRVVFLLVTYIRESVVDDHLRYEYLKILRGCASSHELRLLLYYFTTKTDGESETSRYLLKNDFFKHVQFDNPEYSEQLNDELKRLHGIGLSNPK